MENGKLKPLINLIALPKLLRMYLKEQPQNINYKDNNKANLYSKERTISVKQYKQNMKEHGNREKRYINLNDRIRVNNYLKYNESLQSYKTNKKMWIANKTITQNNVDFLKRYRNNMIKYALEDRDEANSEGPPDPYSSAMNSIGYKINLAQNMVNKAKIKEQKVKGLPPSSTLTNNLNALRVVNLKKRAKNIGLKGYSKLRRAELLNAIRKKQ